MATDINLAAACGLYCGMCEHHPAKCPGCGAIQGKPFWTAYFGIEVCPLHDCAVNQKQLEHCGLCAEFPCEKFLSLRDPSQSDAEAEKGLRQRQADLLSRKEIGTAAWLLRQE
jgi:hypothetical protein